ncbi:hypothetical protein P7K49_002997 [Saguinus oedipus]|uniref:Uncharacterized protein n=1 Tax=Saguinus oedipus TaxID=9490 RepID=A0ABQ9WJW3_SAGOE|nr:hypothetical protein P7K49_002997 [Saguinus oedipus]
MTPADARCGAGVLHRSLPHPSSGLFRLNTEGVVCSRLGGDASVPPPPQELGQLQASHTVLLLSFLTVSSGEASTSHRAMSRRSQRLTRYSQGDDDGGSSSSGGSSVAGSQSTLFKDSPLRTLKRKSSNMKRPSPEPQLGLSCDPHTSYYSESLVRESYIGSPRAAFLARSALEELHSDPDWGDHLRVRKRRGTGGSESSRASGLVAGKATEDFLGSSSGYSSEDDYVEDGKGRGSRVTETEPESWFPAGYSDADLQSSGSRLQSVVSRVGSLLWMVATSPVQHPGKHLGGLPGCNVEAWSSPHASTSPDLPSLVVQALLISEDVPLVPAAAAFADMPDVW